MNKERSTHVYAQGHFGPRDIEVRHAPSRRAIDPLIEAQIDGLWERAVRRAQEKGIRLYNGISYRANYVGFEEGNIILELAEIDYKTRDMLKYIPELLTLPDEYHRKGCYVCTTLRTSDDYYILVELSGLSMNTNTLDFVGGIMETTIPVLTGEDIFSHLYHEIQEEVGITRSGIASCVLRAVFKDDATNVGFYFETTCALNKKEVEELYGSMVKDTDIASLVIVPLGDYREALLSHNRASKQDIARLFFA